MSKRGTTRKSADPGRISVPPRDELHPRTLAEQIRTGQIKLTSLDKRTQAVVLAEMARQANGLTAEDSADFLALDGVTGRFVHMAPPTNHPDAIHDYRKQG